MVLLRADSLADIASWPKTKWGIPEPPRDGPTRTKAKPLLCTTKSWVMNVAVASTVQKCQIDSGRSQGDASCIRFLKLRSIPKQSVRTMQVRVMNATFAAVASIEQICRTDSGLSQGSTSCLRFMNMRSNPKQCLTERWMLRFKNMRSYPKQCLTQSWIT